MRARQHRDLAGDVPHVLRTAAVEALFLLRDHLAHDLLLETVESSANFAGAVGVLVAQSRHHIGLGLADRGVALELLLDGQGGLQRLGAGLLDCLDELLVLLRRDDFALFLASLLAQLVLHVEQRLHRVLGAEQRFQHDVFRDDLGAAFDHHQAVARADDDQIQIALGFGLQSD